MFPELAIGSSRFLHVGESLGDELVRCQAVEAQAALGGVGEILVVGRVAEQAGSYRAIGVVALRMSLGKQMVERQRQPARQRRGSIKAIVAAFEAVALVDLEGIAAESIVEAGHGFLALAGLSGRLNPTGKATVRADDARGATCDAARVCEIRKTCRRTTRGAI